MIKNIAFAVDDLTSDQFSYTLIKSMNELAESGTFSPIIFSANIPKLCITPMFAVMNILESYNYSGILISTSFSSLNTIIGCVGPSDKYLYLWNPEWLRPDFVFEKQYNILHAHKIPIIVRSQYYKSIIENNFDITPIICQDFQVGELFNANIKRSK